MLAMRWLPNSLVLLGLMMPASSTASAKGRLGKPTGAVLHRLAKGADRLEVSRASGALCAEPIIRVTDANEIEELLRLLDGLRDTNMIHGCTGHPVTKLYRGGELVVEFSVDHGDTIRTYGALDRALKPSGDSNMTTEMASQVAAWYGRHGLHAYQMEVEQQASAGARVQRAIAVFPPATQKFLSGRYRSPRNDFSGLVAVFTKEVPDTHRQALLLLRSLAQLVRGEPAVLHWPLDELRRAIPQKAFFAVLNAAASDSQELLGALFLEDYELTKEWLAGKAGPLPELRDRFAQRIAREPVNEQFLGFVSWMGLARDLSPQTQEYLFQAVSRWAQEICFSDSIHSGFLAGWIGLAVKRQMPPWFVRALREAVWSCPLDAAGARVILRTSQGELPNPEDLPCVDYRTLNGVREAAQQRGTAADIDFAFANLLKDGRAFHKVMRWLGPLAGLTEEQVEAELRSAEQQNLGLHLQDWWKTARSTYQPPKTTDRIHE